MKNSTVLQIGVVGCGQIAQMIYLPYLSVSPQYRIAAVNDLSQKVMDAASDIYGIPKSRCFADFHKLVSLDESYRIEWQYVHRCICESRQSVTGPEDAALDIRFMTDIIRKL
jgi:hypothetical protein